MIIALIFWGFSKSIEWLSALPPVARMAARFSARLPDNMGPRELNEGASSAIEVLAARIT